MIHLENKRQCIIFRDEMKVLITVMIRTFPSLYSLYYFTILAIFPIALAPFLSVLPLLAIVPAFLSLASPLS